MKPGRGSRLEPRSPPGVGALTQARGSQRGKYCLSKPRRGEWLGPQNPSSVGASLQTRGSQKGKHYPSRPRRGEWLGPQNPLAVGALLQTRGPQEGEHCSQNLVTRRVQTAGIDPCVQGWRSSAAIAAAVTASTICCREGGESAPGAFAMLEFATRGGSGCVCSRCLDIRGGNGGTSLSLCFPA